MKHMAVALLLGLLAVTAMSAETSAETFGLRLSVGPSLPLGDFGESEDIIEPGLTGSYDATGGGAETGFGFNVELEAQLAQRVFAGAGFGYSRFGANVDDIMKKGLTPAEVQGIDATWTFTSLGIFVRVEALEKPALGLYGKVGLGASKVKNSFDIHGDIPDVGSSTVTSDFDLGNQFFFAGALGGEYKISERVYLVGELRYTDVLTEGTEAGATVMEYEINGTQVYNMQMLDIVLGVRIPLSGI